jgi:membrane-bound metal-dependent hydrolase YbcI (DUF457 family)
MPFPLGHTAIGLAAFETVHKPHSWGSRLRLLTFITALSNLPDIDILFGLLINGNGGAFHRGPTHSLLFAIGAGYLTAWLSRRWHQLPSLSAGLCALLIFSHVVADLLLTSAPVSIFWPLEVNWTVGHSSWGDVLGMALFQSVQDIIIAVMAGLYLFILRQLRGTPVFTKESYLPLPKGESLRP